MGTHKFHARNKDFYLATDVGRLLYVDISRTDSYVENGTITKPFKTVQAAINYAETLTPSYDNPIGIVCPPGKYTEQITVKYAGIHLYGYGQYVTRFERAGTCLIIQDNGVDPEPWDMKVVGISFRSTTADYSVVVQGIAGTSLAGNELQFRDSQIGGTNGIHINLANFIDYQNTYISGTQLYEQVSGIWCEDSESSGAITVDWDNTGDKPSDGSHYGINFIRHLPRGAITLLNAGVIGEDYRPRTLDDSVIVTDKVWSSDKISSYLFASLPITHNLYVDKNRVDSYTEDGSMFKPFKTIQAAIDAATGATVYNRINVNIAPGEYVEQLVMKNWVHLIALIPDSVWVKSSVGDVLTTSVDANITNIIFDYTGADSSKVALKCNNGAIMVLREVSAFGTYTGVEVNSGAIVILYGGGTLTGEADSFIVKNGGYVAFYSTTLSGWGAPYYDLTIEAGGYVDVMDVQLYNERLNNLGTLNLVTPASRIKNDSTVSGATVKDALETLDSTKYEETNEIKIKVYSQDAEPALSADQKLAIWIDTDDSNRVYLVFRRGAGDQVSVELGP